MVWTSKELKKKGLARLREDFAKAYLAVLLYRVFTDFPVLFLRGGRISEMPPEVSLVFLTVFLAAVVLFLSVFNVGKNIFFLELGKDRARLGSLWRYFSEGAETYFSVVRGMLLRYTSVFAGALIFIVPGIISYYSTFFVPWILAEHPRTRPGEALRISRDMAKGQKMNIFIMQMTFAGWFVLSLFLVHRFCLVLPETLAPAVTAAVFALPFVYYQAAAAELYAEMSGHRAENGRNENQEI